jgi:hypothetical protein
MIYDLRFEIYDLRSVIYDLWFMIYDLDRILGFQPASPQAMVSSLSPLRKVIFIHFATKALSHQDSQRLVLQQIMLSAFFVPL